MIYTMIYTMVYSLTYMKVYCMVYSMPVVYTVVHYLYIPSIQTHLWHNEIPQNQRKGEQLNMHLIACEMLAQVALIFVDVHIVKLYITVYIMV
jgi:hypothetical protein